jgi:rare lipoprotein A (peptidoglycan hydrolase)
MTPIFMRLLPEVVAGGAAGAVSAKKLRAPSRLDNRSGDGCSCPPQNRWGGRSTSCHNRSAVFFYPRWEETDEVPVQPKSVRVNQAGGHCWRACALVLVLAACGSSGPAPVKPAAPGPHFKVGQPYQIDGRWYYPRFVTQYEATGIASWYGDSYHGRRTANGEIYDMYALTAAHPTLQLPSVVEVVNLENGRSLALRVNDRGPFVDNRLIDLSLAAARELGFERQGLAQVQVRYLGLAHLDEAPIRPGEERRYAAMSCHLPAPERLVC